jgi:hypothetical protein
MSRFISPLQKVDLIPTCHIHAIISIADTKARGLKEVVIEIPSNYFGEDTGNAAVGFPPSHSKMQIIGVIALPHMPQHTGDHLWM